MVRPYLLPLKTDHRGVVLVMGDLEGPQQFVPTEHGTSTTQITVKRSNKHFDSKTVTNVILNVNVIWIHFK